MGALLIQASQAGEEDIFKVGGYGNESVFWRDIGEDVNLRAAGHELIGDDRQTAGVILDVVARYRFAPYLALETAHRDVRRAGKEPLAHMDDGHVAAQFHHVLDDVRGQDHDDVV